ncbi:NYN domain-containing protein [Candidatus Poribacteria bacterium]|nr:NYN domain-containing protein [Candidatus Poribacteria bacterium]
MPVIIDGHNLIGKMSSISLADPDDEQKLVDVLTERLRYHYQKVIVVFDKGSDAEFAPRRRARGLRVIFAPPESSADAIIIDMIKKDPNPKGLTIVSSDNEIRRCARSRRARLILSEEFARDLQSAPADRPRTGTPPDGHEDIDVNDWLDYFKKGKV